jgi:PAS domain S-box-containing protein
MKVAVNPTALLGSFEEAINRPSQAEGCLKKSRAASDLALVSLASLTTFALTWYFKLLEPPLHWLVQHQENVLDELFVGLLVLLVGFGLYAFRRQRDMQRAQSALLCLHSQLDFQVQQRTAELRNANAALHNEITERNKTERILKESDRRFREMLENVEMLAMTLDKDGKVTFCNNYFLRLTKWKRSEVIGSDWCSKFLPKEFQHLRKRLQESMECGLIPPHQTNPIITNDGDTRQIVWNNTILRDEEGNIVGSASLGQDITEQDKAEVTMRQSEERFRTFFQDSPIGKCITTQVGQFLSVNRTFCNLLGYSEAELMTMDFASVTHEDDVSLSKESALSLLSGKQSTWQVEKRYIARTGKHVWCHVTTSLLRDSDDKPLHFLTHVLDISERKRTEAEMKVINERLLVASREAGRAEFATGILHNVGNVLNSVSVASSCLAGSLQKSKAENLSKVVALIQEHESDLGDFFTNHPKGIKVPAYLASLASHLTAEQNAAIKELADLQKNIEHIKAIVTTQQNAAKNSASREKVELSELVEDALSLNRNALTRSQIELVKDFHLLPPVTVSRHAVLQILINLIRNAMQACDGVTGPKRITTRLSRNQGFISIAISDTGCGISSENLAKMFTHGFTTKTDGHGFGLHSARQAAKDMGGSLTVESEGPGRGATFILKLPA